jgi:Tfp pilus assembly protein FimT
MRCRLPNAGTHESGFSVLELLAVVSVIAIMGTMVLFYATAHKKAFQPDEEALQLADMLQEGRQRALTERRAMRVEINLTTNTARLYDENRDATVATDDVLLRAVTLFAANNVRVDTRPSEIGYNPPESLPVNNAVFRASVYTPSLGQNVCTIRFLANGTAVDAGTNAVGAGAVPTGLTLHIWSPNKRDPSQSDIARSLTVLGATGVVRLWEFDHSSTATNKWEDSRRSSSYGG